MSGFLYTARACGIACLVGAASLLMAGVASAAQPPGAQPLTHAETAGAVAAAHSQRGLSIARTNLTSSGHAASVRAVRLHVASSGVPVYSLNPAFVRGEHGAPAGGFAYYAVRATSGQGTVTIDAVRDHGGTGWHVMKAAGGDLESTLAAKLPAGARLLNEPQLGAWYAWTGDGVTLLKAGMPALRDEVGRTWSLAGYQHLVAERYGDKLAGSDYAEKGMIGGYGVAAAATAARPVNATSSAGTGLWIVAGTAVAAAAGVTAAPAARRRLRRR